MSFVVILCICLFWAICAKELVVVKQYENESDKNNVYYYCITNTSFPLSWLNDNYIESQQAPSTYIPYSQTNILIQHFSQKWFKENSLFGKINEIILDRRWEDLPLLTTQSDNNTFKYIRTVTTVKQDDFVIPFSVKINKDAQILLCDIRKKNCYWLILEETKIVLKKCQMTRYKGQSCISSINSRFAKNVSDYFNTVIEFNNPAKYLDDKKWTHFKFYKKGNNFIVLKQNPVNEIVMMKYVEKSDTFPINRIFIHSNSNKKGFWKIHETCISIITTAADRFCPSWGSSVLRSREDGNASHSLGFYCQPGNTGSFKMNYYYTTEILHHDEIGLLSNDFNTGICISMFVSMCKSCQLTLILSRPDDFKTLMEETYNHSIWTEIKLFGENLNDSKVILSASTKNNFDSEGFWAIDKIRPCHKKEFRVIKTSEKNVKCELINYEQEIISTNEEMENVDNNCPENTVSRFCIPCPWIFYNNSKTCGRLKICENYNKNKICHCSEGYKTNILDCSSPCSRGTYGHSCKKECKYCKDLQCNHDDGYCTSSCINNYSGLKCNIAPLSVPEVSTTVLEDITQYYDFTSTEKSWMDSTTHYEEFVPSAKNITQKTTILITNKNEQTFTSPITKKIKNVRQYYSTTKISTTKKTHIKTTTKQVNSTTQKTPFDPFLSIIFSFLGFFLMLSVCLLIYFTYSMKKNILPPKYSKLVKNNRSRNTSENSQTKDDEVPFMCEKLEILSRPIKITELEIYIKESIKDGKMNRQFASFSCQPTRSWNYGAQKENRYKNRYENLIPYDHTRVVLEKIDGAEFSDYINANFIDGYRVSKAYIATQSPKKETVYDFWRMIWQTKVRYIVMLSNIHKRKEKKVQQYWPAEVNICISFYDITVQYSFKQVFSEYVRRTFHVTCNNQSRTVEQLHLLTWHNCGIPFYPQNLVPFLRQLHEFPITSESPIVVHCGEGVGKTGIVLLCDISLRMAEDGVVDIRKTLQKLRQQRPNMVKNAEQYMFAHLVLVEYLFGKTTAIGCDELMSVDINEIKNHLKVIKETEWREDILKSFTKNTVTNLDTENGIKLPRHRSRDTIYTYINAVTVDSFKIFEKFIVTHYPVPNTLGYFWRLALEKDVSVMVFLNELDPKEPNPCMFYPDRKNPVLMPVDYLTVKFINNVSSASYDLITTSLLMNGETISKELKIILMKHWPAGKLYPEKTANFLKCIEDVQMLSKPTKQHVIVACYDGVTASGLFTAMDFVLEKMKIEHVCDVCEAVKTVRRSSKDFIRKEEQFFFLYNAAQKHRKHFFPYINFQ